MKRRSFLKLVSGVIAGAAMPLGLAVPEFTAVTTTPIMLLDPRQCAIYALGVWIKEQLNKDMIEILQDL